MLMVTNSFLVIILNSILLPITEEVREGTSQTTISTYVMYYSKFEQEPSAFIKMLTENLKTKEKPVVNSQKWSRSLTRAVAYQSFSLQSLSVHVNKI